MENDIIKAYGYIRVSTAMQVDGYSLEYQEEAIKKYVEYKNYKLVRTYTDAGKSGKSIAGREQFQQMLSDVKSDKDGVSFVIVYKLSRFGRNAADILVTLQELQKNDVNLCCVADDIDSSKDSGKLMISILAAIAQIERDNIRAQTLEGRRQKARDGKWNGGFPPYGYVLEDHKLVINEDEASAIRTIFDKYTNEDLGCIGISKYLETHGIRKIPRHNGKNTYFDPKVIRKMLENPVYVGKIAYGRRATEKIKGTDNDYHLVKKKDYILVDGIHDPIVSEETWNKAQVKLLVMSKKYEKVNRGKGERVHLLSGILKCPVCGAGMLASKSTKKRPDGTPYADYNYYFCKHRKLINGKKCNFSKQIKEDMLDDAVAEIISSLVSKPKFANLIQQKINLKIDTNELDTEIKNNEKQIRQYKKRVLDLCSESDELDPDSKHYNIKRSEINNRIEKLYDKIEEFEELLSDAKAKKITIEAEQITAQNIYKILIYFDKFYKKFTEVEKRQFVESLISDIQLYEEKQPNGQWIKSVHFTLPLVEGEVDFSLDNGTHDETVVKLSKGEIDSKPIKVEFSLEDMDVSKFKKGATYPQIKEYVLHNTGLKVSSLYISQIKRKCGLNVGECFNLPKSESSRQPQCPKEKEKAIVEALKFFWMI